MGRVLLFVQLVTFYKVYDGHFYGRMIPWYLERLRNKHAS